MSVYALKGFGWFLCGVVVAPACYLVSSQVAAERARVEAVDMAILDVKQDIRKLETEFNTRANLAQLERWNGDVLALQAPQSAQFLPGETALAALDPLQGMAGVEIAASVVPSAVPVAAVAQAHVQTAQHTVRAAADPARVVQATAPAVIQSASLRVEDRKPVQAVLKKGREMAMLDSKLLSGSTLDDLIRSARQEAVQLR